MSSGGARARSGPPPQRDAIRNGRSGADWIRLPASGRQGEPPAFPLPRPTKRERAVWAVLWATPQALMWEGAGQEREVANLVRTQVEAEQRGASAALRALVLRMEEHLGLSQPGLARNRWIIVDDAQVAGPAPAEGGAPPIAFSDARDRLRRIADAG